MNERIKQLVDKVDRIKDMYDVGPVQRAAIEDFAQLIILECASLFPQTFTDEQYQRRIDKSIKKHFGV